MNISYLFVLDNVLFNLILLSDVMLLLYPCHININSLLSHQFNSISFGIIFEAPLFNSLSILNFLDHSHKYET